MKFSGIKTYEFEYDGLNRLTDAQYADGDKYSTNYGYDKNGNIDHLERWIEIEGAKQQIDDLVYHYHSGGNQLKVVNDNPTLTHHEYGFADNGSFQNTEYNYDENGNMIEDLNKGIDLITYNHLNLPTHIYFANNGTAGRRIGYVYTADGIKLRKYTHLNTNAEGLVTDYVGAFVYENSELQFIQTSEGRLVPNGGGGYNYEYALKDHRGNTRVMFDQTGEVLQDQSYYPFGMSMGEALTFDIPSSLPDNKYLYNGKELQDDFDLGWYDYGARFYDPAIGRWHVIDPMCEIAIRWTPYQYTYNNAVRFIDPDGMFSRIPYDLLNPPKIGSGLHSTMDPHLKGIFAHNPDEFTVNNSNGEIKKESSKEYYRTESGEVRPVENGVVPDGVEMVDKITNSEGESEYYLAGSIKESKLGEIRNASNISIFGNAEEGKAFYDFVGRSTIVEYAAGEVKVYNGTKLYVGTDHSKGATSMIGKFAYWFGNDLVWASHTHPTSGGGPSIGSNKKPGDLYNAFHRDLDTKYEVYEVNNGNIWKYDKNTYKLVTLRGYSLRPIKK